MLCFLAGTISSTLPAGTISDASAQQSRHIAIPGRLWLYVVLFIGFVILLLALPVLWGIVSEAASSAAEKAAPGTFLLGLGVLFVGLVAGIEILDIVGASLAGLVVIGVIVDNYLGTRVTERATASSTPPVSHSLLPSTRGPIRFALLPTQRPSFRVLWM